MNNLGDIARIEVKKNKGRDECNRDVTQLLWRTAWDVNDRPMYSRQFPFVGEADFPRHATRNVFAASLNYRHEGWPSIHMICRSPARELSRLVRPSTSAETCRVKGFQLVR